MILPKEAPDKMKFYSDEIKRLCQDLKDIAQQTRNIVNAKTENLSYISCRLEKRQR